MTVTFFNYATTPTDNGTNTADPTAVTPPSSMLAGDLVVLIGDRRASSGTLTISQAGGQTWNALTQSSGNTQRLRTFWCIFNGTWSANPSITMGGALCNNVLMLVFRSSYGVGFTADNAIANATFSAPGSPYTVTITGVTRNSSIQSVAVAIWAVAAANTWGSLSGTGWSVSGLTAQYRNTSGSDQTITAAYNIGTGATNNVSQNESAGTAGVTSIMSFKEMVTTKANKSAYLFGAAGVTSSKTSYLLGGDTSPAISYIAFIVPESAGTPAKSSKSAFISPNAVASSSKAVYLRGSESALSNKNSFINGQDTSKSNKSSYASGQDTSTSSKTAYLCGSENTSDSVSCYLSGSSDTKDNNSAYTLGSASASSSAYAFTSGTYVGSSSKSAYLYGRPFSSAKAFIGNPQQPAVTTAALSVEDVINTQNHIDSLGISVEDVINLKNTISSAGIQYEWEYTSRGSKSAYLYGQCQTEITYGDVIFEDSFETGDLSRWNGTNAIDGGHLSASTAAKLQSGTYGLQAYMADNTAMYVEDKSPVNEKEYHVRWFFDPNSCSFGLGDYHYQFSAHNTAGTYIVRFYFGYNITLQWQAGLYTDSGAWTNSAWYTAYDRPFMVEMAWKASSAPGANDGYLKVYIDNVLKANLTGVDNDTYSIDYIRLGTNGVDTGTRGTVYFDHFKSTRTSHIGWPPSKFAYLNSTDTLATTNKSAYLEGTGLVTSSKTAYLAGSTSATGNKPVYLLGQLSSTSSKSGYLSGLDTAKSNKSSFLSGSVSDSSSKTAYLEGVAAAVDTSSSKTAYTCGQDTASSTHSAYTYGQSSTSGNKNAYLAGQSSATSNKTAYTHGQASATSSKSANLPKVPWWLASTLTITKGSIESGTLESTYVNDANLLVLNELTPLYGFAYDFTFGDEDPLTDRFYSIHIRGYYEGNPAHNIKLQQKNFTTGLFDNVTGNTTDFPTQTSEQDYEFFLLHDTQYYSGGKTVVRFIHTSNGSAGHHLHINYMELHLDVAVDDRRAYLSGIDTAKSNAYAYTHGSLSVTSNKPAYLKGSASTLSKKSSYLYGGEWPFLDDFNETLSRLNKWAPLTLSNATLQEASGKGTILGNQWDSSSAVIKAQIDRSLDDGTGSIEVYFSMETDDVGGKSITFSYGSSSLTMLFQNSSGNLVVAIIDSITFALVTTTITTPEYGEQLFFRVHMNRRSGEYKLKAWRGVEPSTWSDVASGFTVGIPFDIQYTTSMTAHFPVSYTSFHFFYAKYLEVEHKSAYLAGQSSLISGKFAYLAGSTNVTSSNSAFLNGLAGSTSNKNAYLHGQQDTTSNISAYTNGSADTSSSKQAYLSGQQATSSNASAYLSGSQTTSDSQSAYTHGSIDLSSDQSAYLSGLSSGNTSSTQVYLVGQANSSSSKTAYLLGTDVVQIPNYARSFDGQDDIVYWSSIADLAGQPATISAWVRYKGSNSNNNNYIFNASRTGNSFGVVMNLLDGSYNQKLGMYRSGGTAYGGLRTAEVVERYQWVHLLVENEHAEDWTTTKLYVNGVRITDVDDNRDCVSEDPTIGNWTIGGRLSDAFRFINADIGEVAVWNRLLTDEEKALLSSHENIKSATFIRDSLLFCEYPVDLSNLLSGEIGTPLGTVLTDGPDMLYLGISSHSAYLSGSQQATSAKSAYLSGASDANKSSKNVFLQGQSSAKSNISAYLKGLSNTSSKKLAYLGGSAVSTSRKPGYLAGLDTARSRVPAFLTSLNTAGSQKHGYLAGIDTAKTSTNAFLSGGIIAISKTLAFLQGNAHTKGNVHAYLIGSSNTSSRLQAYANGQQLASSSKSGYLSGYGSLSSSKSAYLRGWLTTGSQAHAFLQGQSQALSSAKAYLSGASAGNKSSQFAFLVGKLDTSSRISAFLKGSANVNSAIHVYTSGISSANKSSVSAYLSGKLDATDTQIAYLKGGAYGSSGLPGYLAGWDISTSSARSYVSGSNSVLDSKHAWLCGSQLSTTRTPAFLLGESSNTSKISAFLAGSADVRSTSQPAYINGELTVSSAQEAFTAGKAQTSDSQTVYLESVIRSRLSAYLVGEGGISDSSSAYLNGTLGTTSNIPAYMVGGTLGTSRTGCFLRGTTPAYEAGLSRFSGSFLKKYEFSGDFIIDHYHNGSFIDTNALAGSVQVKYNLSGSFHKRYTLKGEA